MNFVQKPPKKCACGSGKKYKNCCRTKDKGFISLIQKIKEGSIPFGARVVSSDHSSSGITIESASVISERGIIPLITSPISLNTNAIAGESTSDSAINISIPINGSGIGSVLTSGNATLTSDGTNPGISILNNKKKLKAEGKNGLFVTTYLQTQRDTGLKFINVLFGVSGQEEVLVETESKNRPHIAFYPNGEGKYIRLFGHECSISTESTYYVAAASSHANTIQIKSESLNETATLNFTSINSNSIILCGIEFQN